jgi:hypothetical protein
VENAIAAAAAAAANDNEDDSDGVRLGAADSPVLSLSPATTQPAPHPPDLPDPPDPPPGTSSPSASTTGSPPPLPPPPTRALRSPYDDVMDDIIDSALDSLPDCARELVDLAPLKEDDNLQPYRNLQRTLTHAIESEKAEKGCARRQRSAAGRTSRT